MNDVEGGYGELVQLQAACCAITMRYSLTKRCRSEERGAKGEKRGSRIALRPSNVTPLEGALHKGWLVNYTRKRRLNFHSGIAYVVFKGNRPLREYLKGLDFEAFEVEFERTIPPFPPERLRFPLFWPKEH